MKQRLEKDERITMDPDVMVGKPVIRGTRIPVYVVVNLVGEGVAFEEIMRQYPDLKRQDILAAVKFAAKFTDFEEVEA
jgi:uncharacterized protein (DUF433 family)